MKISAYLAHLSQPNVTELVLTSGERPMAVVGDDAIPFGHESLTEDGLVSALFALGGGKYTSELDKRAASWTARAEPVGTLAISAKKTGGKLEVRLSLLRKDKKPEANPASSVREARPPESPAKAPPAAPAKPVPKEPGSEPRMFGRVVSGATIEHREETRPARRDPRFESDGPPPPKVDGSNIDVRLPPPGAPKVSSHEPTVPRSAATPSSKDEPRKEPSFIGKEPQKEPSSLTREPAKEPSFVAKEPSSLTREPQKEPSFLGKEPQKEPSFLGKEPQKEPSFLREAAKEAPTRPYTAVPGEATLTSMSGIPRPPELDTLLRAAVESNASDLHLVAGRPPLFRVAFELAPRCAPLPEVLVEKMVISIVPARLRGTLETDGSADFAIEGPEGARFRVNVASQRTGFKIALRVIPREVPTLAALGLPEGVAQATHHHQGLIVVTGPTGHGKTTTLAAIVDRLNTERSHHIITVEDPVEHVHPRKKAMMSQREVGVTTKSFLTALKGSLREDPDVIVVGELRDVETVRMAVSAGETGHLVLGTMNTPNAAKAIERLIDLFPPGDQAQIRMTLAGALRLVVGQRLVPSPDKKRLHAAIELLPGSTSLSALIRDNRTFQIPSLQQRGKGLGIVRLDESLAALVREKKVTVDDAKAVAEAPGELEALVANRGDKPAEKKPEGLLESLFGRKG